MGRAKFGHSAAVPSLAWAATLLKLMQKKSHNRHWAARAAFTLALILSPVASADISIIGSTVHQSSFAPGDTLRGSIQIRNTGAENTEVRVYVQDYQSESGGVNVFGPAGSHARSCAPWITLDTTRAPLRPGESVEVFYDGRVPNNAGLSGSHWCLVMLEEDKAIVPPDNSGAPRDKPRAAIATKIRHAVQLICELGGGAPAKLEVAHRSMTQAGPATLFELDIRNGSENVARPTLQLELFDLSGGLMARKRTQPARIYPFCHQAFQFELGGTPPGRYVALVTMETGNDDEVFGAQYGLKIGP